MQIKEVMSRDVILASPRETLGEVAQLMAAGDIGFMPVGEAFLRMAEPRGEHCQSAV